MSLHYLNDATIEIVMRCFTPNVVQVIVVGDFVSL
jgi:hypothetical protein